MKISNKLALLSVATLFLFSLYFLFFRSSNNAEKQEFAQSVVLKINSPLNNENKKRKFKNKNFCDKVQVQKTVLLLDASEKRMILLQQEYEKALREFVKKHTPSALVTKNYGKTEDDRQATSYSFKKDHVLSKKDCKEVANKIFNRLKLLKLKQSFFKKFFSFLQGVIDQKVQVRSRVIKVQGELLKTQQILGKRIKIR